jgi:hypothetical protein
MKRHWWLSLLLAAAAALGSGLSFQERAAVQESLSRVHPRMRASWLKEHGLDDSYYTTFRRPDSQGLREVGRWPWGPSWELAGRDTFLYLSSGSGVRILSIADSVQPRTLGQINARGLVSQVVVQDSLLFVACGSWGAQIYSVTDPASPRELGSMDAVIGDLCVKDTLCYAVGGDSFRIYNVASPTQPARIGAVRDSGDLVVVANGHAFSAGRWVMNVYNVTNPARPVWANSRGGPAYAMFVRRNLLFCSSVQPDNMTVLNISNPLSITQVSKVDGYGGDGLFVDDSYAYLSCDYEHSGLFVIDVSDSSRPVLRDSINPMGVTEWDPYVPHSPGYGYLADDYGGLVVLDLHDVNNISESWSGYSAGQSVDVAVDNGRAYVANGWVGTQIVDVTDPSRPFSLGVYDTSDSRGTNAVAARDSFAFVGMSGAYGRRSLRVLDVSTPSDPTLVAEDSCHGWPQDFVLRDSLLYMVEAYMFQVFNVARPREPRLVGGCVAGDLTRAGLVVRDTLAYFIGPFDGLEVFDVADPTAPHLVNTVAEIRAAGCDVIDSLLYVGDYDDSLHIWSFANPLAPYQLSSVFATRSGYGVAVLGRYAYVGCDSRVRVFDVLDPRNPVEVGSCATPYEIRRVEAGDGYVYVCCWEAGVSIFDTFQAGVGNRASPPFKSPALIVSSPVAGDAVSLEFRAKPGSAACVAITDAVGRVLLRDGPVVAPGDGICRHRMDVGSLPAGVYIINVRVGLETRLTRFVKLRRR